MNCAFGPCLHLCLNHSTRLSLGGVSDSPGCITFCLHQACHPLGLRNALHIAICADSTCSGLTVLKHCPDPLWACNNISTQGSIGKLEQCLVQMLSPKDKQNDEYGALHASGIHCTGRIVLNVWRILRSELKLNIYTFESCVAAVLQLRTPHVQPYVLTQWFNGGPAGGGYFPHTCITTCASSPQFTCVQHGHASSPCPPLSASWLNIFNKHPHEPCC